MQISVCEAGTSMNFGVIKKISGSDPKLRTDRVIQGRMKGTFTHVVATRSVLVQAAVYPMESLRDQEE